MHSFITRHIIEIYFSLGSLCAFISIIIIDNLIQRFSNKEIFDRQKIILPKKKSKMN
jgi:hypothetical protein